MLRLWLISLLFLPVFQEKEDPRYEIPFGELSERHQEKCRLVMKGLTTTVPLPLTRVETDPEVYDFLLGELPFTAAVCRILEKASYEVFRDPRIPEEKDARKVWHDKYYLKDGKGMKLRVERAFSEPNRIIFYTYGSYKMSGLPKIWGRSIIVVVWGQKGEILATEAKVFLQVTTAVFRTLAEIGKTIVEKMVRKKSGLFIQAAQWVAEAAREDPEALYNKIRKSKDIDPDVLKEFRRRFLQGN